MNTPTGPEKVYQILKNLACIRDSDIQILRWSSLLKEIRELDGKRVKLWIGRFRLEPCLAHCVLILLETFYTLSASHLLQSVIYWRLVQEENSRFMRFKNIDKISTQLEKKRHPILCLFSLKVENTMTPSFGVQSIKLCSRQDFTRPFCQTMASCPSLNLCGNKRLNSLGSKLYKSIAINPLLQVLFLTPGSFLAKPNPLSFSGGKWLLFSADLQVRISFSGLIFCKESSCLKGFIPIHTT